MIPGAPHAAGCPLRNPWDEPSEKGPGPHLLDPAAALEPEREDHGRIS